MAYYRGDYYRGHGRGDYYRGRRAMGDPFWAGLLKGIVTVGRALIGPQLAPAAPPSAGQPMYQLPEGALIQRGGTQERITAAAQRAGLLKPPPSGLEPMSMQASHTVNGVVVKKRRRMNVLNPRALRRSMRRVQGFAHFASRTIQFTRRVRMKKHRRRAA